MTKKNKGASKEAPKFDIEKAVKGVKIPEGIDYVLVTTDGQVFYPQNRGLAFRHAERKRLEVHTYKV